MKYAAIILMLGLLAAPAWCVDVTLKGEDNDFDAELVQLEGDQVTYRKGRRENTVHIDDFIPESAFLIKRHFSDDTPESQLTLARFALHRSLFEEARKIATRVGDNHEEYTVRARRLAETARVLQADLALDKAEEALDALDTEKARPLLEGVIEDFPDTPAAAKAEVLLGTLKRVELEVRARELEKAAKEAQKEADEEERKRRKPIDDWLNELAEQVRELEEIKLEADKNCREGKTFQGLTKYEDIVESLKRIRKTVKDNRELLDYRGQPEHADRIDDSARNLIVECYYQWAYYLYKSGTYETAATICEHGIRMDPSDRRFLSLKVDIDEAWDPLRGD